MYSPSKRLRRAPPAQFPTFDATSPLSVSLESGYRFRATDHRGYISEAPFAGSTVANRLKKHLNDAGICDGKTMHSFRRGCSITLAALGSQYADMARHVGWKSIKTALHYTQFEKVCSQNGVSSLLSNSTTAAEQAGQNFREKNCLYGCKQLFP